MSPSISAPVSTTEPPARLAQFFKQASTPFCVLAGPSLIFEQVNPAYQALFPGRKLLGRPLLAARPELAGQTLPERLHKLYTSGGPYEAHEEALPSPAGGGAPPRYFTFRYQARIDKDGRPDGILAVGLEVTAQVLARRMAAARKADTLAEDQQLAAQRTNFYQVYEQTPALICILRGPDYRVDYHNLAFQQLYAGRPLLGRTVAETQPEAVAQGLVALLDQVYTTGETHQATEVLGLVQEPGGGPTQERYFDFTYQPFQENGRTVGISVFAFEVTKQVLVRQQEARSQAQLRVVTVNLARANEKLAARNQELLAFNGEATTANQMLIRTNADLDNFVYTASHDLKAPIVNIEGLLDVLGEALRATPPDMAAVQPLLAMMHESVARFQQTIGHLSDIAHLQQELTQTVEAVNLAAVIDSVQLDLAPLLLVTGAQVKVEVGSCPVLSLTPKNVRSIVYNLLSNAIKYRHAARPPQVFIRCQPGRGTCVLSVQDNGLGLTEKQLPRLFGLFQRLHSHVEGSGIGLYIVRKIVENAGGTISVQSQLGEGSTFTVTLPNQG